MVEPKVAISVLEILAQIPKISIVDAPHFVNYHTRGPVEFINIGINRERNSISIAPAHMRHIALGYRLNMIEDGKKYCVDEVADGGSVNGHTRVVLRSKEDSQDRLVLELYRYPREPNDPEVEMVRFQEFMHSLDTKDTTHLYDSRVL